MAEPWPLVELKWLWVGPSLPLARGATSRWAWLSLALAWRSVLAWPTL